MLSAAAGIIPVALAAGVGLSLIVEDRVADAQRKTLEVARLSAAAIDIEVSRALAVLSALTESPMLDGGRFADFGGLAARVLSTVPGWHAVVLALPDGTTVAQAGEVPPEPPELRSFSRVVEERRPLVGYLRRGVDGRWSLPVRMPVMRDGELRYVLTARLSPDVVQAVLAAQRLPADWIAAVYDAGGRRIARSQDHERFIGGAPTPSLARLLEAGEPEGLGFARTLENTGAYTAHVRLPQSGWTLVIGIPTAAIKGGAMLAFALYGGGLLVSLLAAFGAALYSTRRIGRSMDALRRAALRVGQGETPTLAPSGTREIDEVGQALLASAAARRRTESERQSALAELLRTQASLREQVSDLQQLHRLSAEVLQMTGLERQLRAVLGAACALHGAEKGLVKLIGGDGRSLHLCVAQGFSDHSTQVLQQLATGDGAWGARHERRIVVTGSDSQFEALRELAQAEGIGALHALPLRSGEGGVLGVLAVGVAGAGGPDEREMRLMDLCAGLGAVLVERALAQAEADASEQRLQLALDSSAAPFSILSPVRDATGALSDFSWAYVNRAAAALLQRAPDKVLHRHLSELQPELHAAPALFDALAAAIERAEAREVELQATVDGQARWLHVIATPFQGKVAMWSADVTERRRQAQMLQETDRRKDEFIAILAHELRNPLAPIRQATAILRSPAANEAQKGWSYDVIDRQVQQMALLLDDLLDVSRITRGKLELRKASVQLQSMVASAVETARPHFEAGRHRLQLDLPEAPVALQADPLRVAQIVTNLLTNAARYTEAGGVVRLTASIDGDDVLIEVEDNGVGIAEEHLEAVFEMFSQVGAPARRGGGLGIGLALSRAIAVLHGGTLRAHSAGAGHGSRFALRLPLGMAAADPQQPDAAQAPPPTRAGPLRVLIADDNRDAAETLRQVLNLHGHSVAVAYDGEQALQLFRRERPDVLLLDIGMPGLNGYQVASAVRGSDGGAALRLIALTGWGQEKDKHNSRAAGFDHHLTKPVDTQRLLELLRLPAESGTA